jgi:hypothetical protein
MSNYPSGMSASDLIHVGEVDDGEDFRPCKNCGTIRQDHDGACYEYGYFDWVEIPDDDEPALMWEPGEFEEPDYD